MQHLKKLIPALLAETYPSTTNSIGWRPDKFDAYEETLAKAVEHASRFVDDVGAGKVPYWLSLSGVCGCGKTMLARQIFCACMKYNPGAGSLWIRGSGPEAEKNRRPRCVWYSATEFADAIRGDFGLPEYLERDFLVVIDDVGAARDTTNFIADGLYRLANVRLGRWTIFTANLNLGDMSRQIDERFASRLIRDGNIFHRIKAGDYATRKLK